MANSIFSSDSADWTLNACVNYLHNPLILYIEGYKKAADKLIQEVKKESIYLDILVYPILFLYRQYIELQLKHLIQESKTLLEKKKGNSSLTHHNLLDLWNSVNSHMRDIIEEYNYNEIKEYITKEDIKKINEIIREFDKIDPNSFSFRYPKGLFIISCQHRIVHKIIS